MSEVDVCCVGAHPDDVEIAMGGTVASFVAAGLRVGLLDLTDGEPTPYGNRETRMAEAAAAAETLGVAWRRTLSLPNRCLEDTMEARRMVAEVFRETRPRLIFTHHPGDGHPDHVAAASLVMAARFWSKLVKTDMAGAPHLPARIYQYAAVHFRLPDPPSFIVDVSPHLARKLAAVHCYASQFANNPKSRGFTAFIESSAAYFGGLARVDAGEPFFSCEPLVVARPAEVL